MLFALKAIAQQDAADYVFVLENTFMNVTLEQASEANTKDGEELCYVAYTYDFFDHDEIYIDGVGLVPATGKVLPYLTAERNIVFRDPNTKNVLAELPVGLGTEESEYMTVKPLFTTVELPATDNFPAAYREAPIVEQFREKLMLVLNDEFPMGYQCIERDGKQEWITTYKEW